MPDPRAALAVLGEPGWTLLVDAGLAFDAARGDSLRAAQHLVKRRPEAPPAERAAALELVAEGARLATKLGLAGERLLAVRGAVEQATSGRVATWHAQQVAAGARVLEIGCGVGADSIAIAHRAKNLIAADLDPVRAAVAHTNLAAFGLSNARVVPGDGLALLAGDAATADTVFLDPDRRVGGTRSLDPESWSPPLSACIELARASAGSGRRVLVKAAPSLDADAVAGVFRVSYVSHGGECVEAFLDAPIGDGPRMHEGSAVRAVRLPDDAASEELSGDRGDAPEGDVGDALHVPDPAAVRARLLSELCRRHGLALVDARIALLTGPADVVSPWFRTYRVLGACALGDVPAELRRHRASSLRVHTRGIAAAAGELERSWAGGLDRRGGGPVLDVFATRLRDRIAAVLATPA